MKTLIGFRRLLGVAPFWWRLKKSEPTVLPSQFFALRHRTTKSEKERTIPSHPPSCLSPQPSREIPFRPIQDHDIFSVPSGLVFSALRPSPFCLFAGSNPVIEEDRPFFSTEQDRKQLLPVIIQSSRAFWSSNFQDDRRHRAFSPAPPSPRHPVIWPGPWCLPPVISTRI